MKTNLCHSASKFFIYSVLASLNLPAALEDTTGVAVPPSLIEKSENVRREGGLQPIDSMMRELPDLLKCNQEILDEVVFFIEVSHFLSLSNAL